MAVAVWSRVNCPEESVNGPILSGKRIEIFYPAIHTLFDVLLFGESAKVSVSVFVKINKPRQQLRSRRHFSISPLCSLDH